MQDDIVKELEDEINRMLEAAAEEDNIIYLDDGQGNEAPFEFIDSVEYEGKEYAVLFPADDEEADEVIILEFTQDEDGTECFVPAESDEVLQAVFEIFKENHADDIEFFD